MNSNFENNNNKDNIINNKEFINNDKSLEEDNSFFPIEVEKYLNVIFIIIIYNLKKYSLIQNGKM